MLFADTFKVQGSKNLKFHNFPNSTPFLIRDATIANSEIPGLKSFLDDSSIQKDSQILELLKQAIEKMPIIKIHEAFTKGIQYGAKEISNEVNGHHCTPRVFDRPHSCDSSSRGTGTYHYVRTIKTSITYSRSESRENSSLLSKRSTKSVKRPTDSQPRH